MECEQRTVEHEHEHERTPALQGVSVAVRELSQVP